MNKELFLPVSILVAGVLIAGAVIYAIGGGGNQANNSGDSPEKVDSVALELTGDDVVLGNLDAPVTIIEYSDFQCPYCGFFYSQTEAGIRENYIKTGKVKFVYRHFAFLGQESRALAGAVECAKDHGKFWQYHDEAFNAEIADGQENNGNLNKNLFLSLAKKLELDADKFSSCLNSNKYDSKVQNDYISAQKAGVNATPTSFVNGQKVSGALPYAQFKVLIDQELAK